MRPQGAQYIRTGSVSGVRNIQCVKSTPIYSYDSESRGILAPTLMWIRKVGVSSTVLGHAPLLQPEKGKWTMSSVGSVG